MLKIIKRNITKNSKKINCFYLCYNYKNIFLFRILQVLITFLANKSINFKNF